jgi:Tfp pilus assembly PilM family ATPase
MARACGLRVGPRRYELVVIDGSPKKHKITAYTAGEFDPTRDNPVAAAVEALKSAAKSYSIPHDNVGLVIDTGYAAFRRMTLPFSDDAKIEQVLRYEVESKLPQWNIDDVIVDYHKLTDHGTASDLLVTAVPKEDLRSVLELCEQAGIEPLEAELETSAMVNAAMTAEICNIDDAQLLVHVGDYSTSVVVVDSGEVREMRVIHIGALTHEAPQAAAAAAAAADGDEAVEEGGAPDPIEASRRVDQAIKRIRRELGRTLSAARTINPIDAIYVCGMELPGLVGETVLDVPLYVLDCFNEDGGQPADGFGQLVVAYGAAVRQLGGGVLKPSLRRDELRYTGTMERVEFPLAIAAMLLATLVVVVNILQYREERTLENKGMLFWLESSNNYQVGTGSQIGNMYPVTDEVRAMFKRFDTSKGKKPDLGNAKSYLEVLQKNNSDMLQSVKLLQEKLRGGAGGEHPPSAFVGTAAVLEMLDEKVKDKTWRVTILRIQASYQPSKSSQKPDLIKLTMDLVFRDDDVLAASTDYEDFRTLLEQQPWLYELERRGTKELEDGTGVHVQGLPLLVDVSKYGPHKKTQEPSR